MLNLLANTFRHRGPCGMLFVLLFQSLVFGAVLWPITRYVVPVVAAGVFLWLCRQWRRRERVRNVGVSRLPKLAPIDLHCARRRLCSTSRCRLV
jgi:hypothetical protein